MYIYSTCTHTVLKGVSVPTLLIMLLSCVFCSCLALFLPVSFYVFSTSFYHCTNCLSSLFLFPQMQPRCPQQVGHPPDRRRQERGTLQGSPQEDGQQALLLVRTAQDQGLPLRPGQRAVGAAAATAAAAAAAAAAPGSCAGRSARRAAGLGSLRRRSSRRRSPRSRRSGRRRPLQEGRWTHAQVR